MLLRSSGHRRCSFQTINLRTIFPRKLNAMALQLSRFRKTSSCPSSARQERVSENTFRMGAPNITLVPTRKSEALLLAAQRGRYV